MHAEFTDPQKAGALIRSNYGMTPIRQEAINFIALHLEVPHSIFNSALELASQIYSYLAIL